jgi:hypothetical protein
LVAITKKYVESLTPPTIFIKLFRLGKNAVEKMWMGPRKQVLEDCDKFELERVLRRIAVRIGGLLSEYMLNG